MNNDTMFWKFPGMQKGHIWKLVHAENELAFFSSDHRLAVVMVDLSIGSVTLAVNDQDGARVKTFDAKEPLCEVVEQVVRQYRPKGA